MHHLLNGKSKTLSLYSKNTIKDYISCVIMYESQNTFILNHLSRPQKMIKWHKIMRGGSGVDIGMGGSKDKQCWEVFLGVLFLFPNLEFSVEHLCFPLFCFSFKDSAHFQTAKKLENRLARRSRTWKSHVWFSLSECCYFPLGP